ncbi:hypothetical protein H8E52_05035, partial [bacterium]|nr:hypothetical protein [bacterium]
APWIGLPFLLAFGLFLSGLMGYWRGWGGMQFNFIALTSYSIFAISGGPVAKYFLFDGMPISRRRLFAILVLPGLAILTLGYGAGRIGLALLESRHEVIVYGMEEDSYGLRLPLHLWEIDWKGETPRVEALSGENPAVKSLPIATAGGPRLYKPYTTHESSSPQFVAEQLRRALLLHCGESPPVEELRDRYFRLDENGKTVLKGSTLTVFEDYPELKLRPEWGTFPYIFTLTGLWFFLALWIYFRFFMAEVGEGRRKGAFVSILVIMLLMHMIPFFTFMFDWIDDDTFVAMQQILIRDVATAFPGSILLVWLVGGLLFAGAYRLCERQFQKVELPSDDSASCMMNL